MTIELLYNNKKTVKTTNINELPRDLNELAAIQITDFTKNDISLIENLYDIDASILNNNEDIEISSHYLEKDNQLALSFSLPYYTSQKKIEEEFLCIIIKNDTLISFMKIDFDQFFSENQNRQHSEKLNSSTFSANTLLLLVLEIISDYFADLTELIAKNIKATYAHIQQQNNFSEQEINEITKLKFNNLIVKEALNEFRRIMHLLRKSRQLTAATVNSISSELNDLSVINEYIQNNFERLDDLKDYVSSRIDLEQNRIFKILTIVTMCISLPTLIAGIYGMNFINMPELQWKYGYIYAILLLLASFTVPLIWFKRKKWF